MDEKWLWSWNRQSSQIFPEVYDGGKRQQGRIQPPGEIERFLS